MKEIINVKIKKCSTTVVNDNGWDEYYWYRDAVGEVLQVHEVNDKEYIHYVDSVAGIDHYLLKEDCEIVC